MLKPKASIRRFDVFAEYNRQQAIKEGMPADQAKGYGLWLAKIVAARRFGAPTKLPSQEQESKKPKVSKGKWRRLSGKPQTDKLFDKEIMSRMGLEFYRQVFVPAIRQAIDNAESYRDIRDTIRSDWKP